MNLIILIIFLVIIFNYKKKIEYSKYSVKGYSDLKNDSSTSLTPGGIPKIIIKTSWQTRDHMPVQMINALKRTRSLNPDYQLYYFDNLECDEFMKDYSPRVFEAYNKVIPGAFKADLFRVCILEKYGGCYSDIGHIPLVSFNEINGSENIVLVKDEKHMHFIKIDYAGIHNALMCSVKNHGFFKTVIDKTCENIENEYYGESSLDVTGPMMIGKQFNCYFIYNCSKKNNNLINPGDFVYRDTKVRFLTLSFHLLKFKRGFYIYLGDKPVIDTKFNDYYNVMYKSKNTIGYKKLWKSKQIYN